ncbi:hypothetical protein EV714DRAFT_284784 [Schizophyllum commune]
MHSHPSCSSSAAFIERKHDPSWSFACVPRPARACLPSIFATFHPSLSPSARGAVFAQVDALLRAQRVPGLRGWCVGPPVGVGMGPPVGVGVEGDTSVEESSVGDTSVEASSIGVTSVEKSSIGGEGGARSTDASVGEKERSGRDGNDAREGRGIDEGIAASNERAEGRDFGGASLPHEWHHEIYRLVKRVTVGKFFIYQIDTERGRGWRTDAGRERGRRADAERARGKRDDGLMSREDTPTASTPDRREEDVQMEGANIEDARAGREDEVHSRRDGGVRRQAETDDESHAHTWHARGWREERRWRARL